MGSDSDMFSSIDLHTIPNLQIPLISLEKEFDILQEVGEGWFAKVFLAEHRKTRQELVLKAIHKESTTKKDLITEFHYSYNLGILNSGKVIVRTYDILFESHDCYIYAAEYGAFGDLTSNVSDIGIGEIYTKKVAKQIASALDFLHFPYDLVHRDIKLDNILIFKSDFSRVKLSDFGETKRRGCKVARFNEWVPYCPPEILSTPQDKEYTAEFVHDTWQFGILIFVCLTGSIPWQKADRDSDPLYQNFQLWGKSRNFGVNGSKVPKSFKSLSTKARRLFRKLFEPNPGKRIVHLGDEIGKYSDDKWLVKIPEKPCTDDELSTNMSMLSFHSSLAEKNKLLSTLNKFGIETTVDHSLKKSRIKDWIQSSTIEEEQDEEFAELPVVEDESWDSRLSK